MQQSSALILFHKAAERIPAYKDFLRRERFKPAQVKSLDDFRSVPLTDTKNYIAAYPLAARCWDGNLAASARLIATSSGTSGELKFWPRSEEQEQEAALVHEWLYKTYFQIHKHSTLILIGFPMGIYISGVATLLPTWLASLKGYQMTVMSVGNNKAEMLRSVRTLSTMYDQIILVGHPFFIKDVIETGLREGIAWRKKNLGMMFCSGDITEAWRAYVGKLAGTSRIFTTYGSSEMLLMAYETPFAIAVKKKMETDRRFLKQLTGETAPPQIFQYDPRLRYIESVEDPRIGRELVFTCTSGVPLIRFNLHDRGDVFPLARVREIFPYQGGIEPLPLVALWGRSDDTLKFHAVNIYPEHIKLGLMDRRFLRSLTGKFVMQKHLGRSMDERLEIHVELSPGIRLSKRLAHDIQHHVTERLTDVNLEYSDMSSRFGRAAHPRIALASYQDPQYFKPGLKPCYIDPKSKIV